MQSNRLLCVTVCDVKRVHAHWKTLRCEYFLREAAKKTVYVIIPFFLQIQPIGAKPLHRSDVESFGGLWNSSMEVLVILPPGPDRVKVIDG